jgi:hypothetical protein
MPVAMASDTTAANFAADDEARMVRHRHGQKPQLGRRRSDGCVSSDTCHRRGQALLRRPSHDEEASECRMTVGGRYWRGGVAARLSTLLAVLLTRAFSGVEIGGITQRTPDGRFETVARDPSKVVWPDASRLGPDGYLYFPAAQISRIPQNNPSGKSLIERPFRMFKVKIANHCGEPNDAFSRSAP